MSTTQKEITTNTYQSLSRDQVIQAANALNTIGKLSQKRIKEKNDDAELKGSQDFLNRLFSQHASEFIQAWLIIADEYTPLLGMFAIIDRRAKSFTAAREREISELRAPVIKQEETK